MATWRELTFLRDSADIQSLVIDDDRVETLTDPVRWRILETIGNGKSVGEVSQLLGITDARVLRHMQRLAQTKVVQLQENGRDSRDWRCVPIASKVRILVSPDDIADVGKAMPVDVVNDFNQAFRESRDGIFGPTFQTSFNHNRSRLSEDQAAEFSRRLLNLIEDYFPPGEGDPAGIKYGFFGVLTPIDLPPIESSET